MSDHRAVQETETAAAGKVSELTEAMIRVLLQQRAEQAKQPPGDPELFRSFYQAYRENGVDKRTARDAAADAAMGLGSKDSPAMAKAEAQAISHAQEQAKEYRSATAIAVDPNTATAVQQQANTRRKDIEKSLGIQDQPLAVRAQTINGLDPNRTQAALKTTYQTTLEQNGASPQTAASASKDLANQKGATDSPPIAQAHREIHQHGVLKHMYQGIFEQHGVSPEVASAAADQLAKGNGANRSAEVRRAHKQALANIKNPQRVSSAQSPKPKAKENNAAYPAETNEKADKPPASVEQPQDNLPAQRIWNKYSPGENGVFESMAKGNPKMQQMSDQLIAKAALLAGEDPKDVQRAISQYSPYAQSLKGPSSYASRTIGKAEQSSEVREKRAKEKAQNARPGRKEAQQRQANQTRRSGSKTQSKKKVKARETGMGY